jgi:hypothetical protein
MSKYNEQPNQVNGNETLMLQQSSFKETESKVYNVVLTICQITETHKCELTDNSLEVFNIFNMDYKIKNQINQLLKPSIILSKKITMPVIQDILYLDVQNNQNELPIYAIELPICFTFFPDKKISHYEFHSNPHATPRRIVKKKEEVQTNHLPINCDCSFCTKLKCDCHSCNPRRFCRCKYCFPLEKENYKPLSSFRPVHDNDIYTNRDKVQVNTFFSLFECKQT